MKADYQNWIFASGLDQFENSYGQCQRVVAEMKKAFPELKIVSGWYHCCFWGERQHWWLVDEDGSIVDPTVSQFPSKGMGDYEPYDGRPLPTGKCMNCGDYIYTGRDVCSDSCGEAYVAYCMNPF